MLLVAEGRCPVGRVEYRVPEGLILYDSET